MPEPFNSLTAIAAPLPQANVDTDKILPAKFLKTVERSGLGKALFYAMRFHEDDSPRADFVLNQSPWTEAGILVALENFGSGSSREHAPWALKDFGLRAILAPSFADIFKQNCIKNGLLPAVLSQQDIEEIMGLVAEPSTAKLHIDLPAQTISSDGGKQWQFEIADHAKEALLTGEDELSRSLKHLDQIKQHFEQRDQSRPWITAIKLS